MSLKQNKTEKLLNTTGERVSTKSPLTERKKEKQKDKSNNQKRKKREKTWRLRLSQRCSENFSLSFSSKMTWSGSSTSNSLFFFLLICAPLNASTSDSSSSSLPALAPPAAVVTFLSAVRPVTPSAFTAVKPIKTLEKTLDDEVKIALMSDENDDDDDYDDYEDDLDVEESEGTLCPIDRDLTKNVTGKSTAA